MSAALSLPDVRSNACGVAVFALDKWAVLDRFLVLGTAGGSYYASERHLRMEHLFNLLACLDEDGPRTVRRIADISRSGRAPRNLPAVAALALAASVGLRQPGTGWNVSSDRTGDTPVRAGVRSLALAALTDVCRIPTDLFAWTGWVRRLRGWGPALSKSVAAWYATAPVDRLVLHAIKYQTRGGISHADLLRLSHPRITAEDPERQAVVRWMLAGGTSEGLDRRLAGSPETNATPSGLLRQLEGAEDLLAVNRLGAGRAAERAAAAKAKRHEREMEHSRRHALLDAWGIDIWGSYASRSRSRDESVRLFGVPSHMLEAAGALSGEADGYLSDPAVEDGAPSYGEDRRVDGRRDSREDRTRPAKVPQASLFDPEEVALAVDLIERFSLPHEAVPSHLKREKAVWSALLADMPLRAMLRNLAVMTRVGLLEEGSLQARFVAERLQDPVLLRRARIHPLAILQAAETYRCGEERTSMRAGGTRRIRQGATWTPVPAILAALDASFHMAFHDIVPSNVRLMLGVDISGSMGAAFIGDSWLSARAAAAAMCLVAARTEARWQAVAYTSGERDYDVSFVSGNGSFQSVRTPRETKQQLFPGLTRLPLSRDMSVAAAAAAAERLPMGSTDCALPIRYATQHGIEVDAFVHYTDNEHNAGPVSPARALARYRAESGIQARLICVGMTATDYSIADPRDPLCLNVVGFDAAAPGIIADFSAGRL